ncbi:MAG: glycosyltransferase family 2 protein [Syntrophaceae bacterium]|nr:glycosyltransferase family 2 protein [Syntrophaceae bacterium]
MISPSSKTLSVIIVNRNTSKLLLDCLRHIYESDLDRRIEVIVVDNGSNDDSVAAVRTNFPQTIVIEANRNLGFAKANNLGYQNSTGDQILLVNTDAMLYRDCISELLTHMEADQRVGMLGPQLVNPDGSRQTSYEITPTLLSEVVGRGVLKFLFPSQYPGKKTIISTASEVETLIGAVLLIRRAAWEALNGFDDEYFFFFEETDLACRLRKSGWLVCHVPQARAIHLQGATAKQYNAAPRIEYYRSRYLFFRKMYGRPSELILKVALTLNLTLNTLLLGLATIVSFGQSERINHKLVQRGTLLLWHMKGFPIEAGLPRN